LHRLTVAKIRSAPPGQWLHDGSGLYFFRSSKTSPGFWAYRWGGSLMGLGSASIVSLAKAREKAAQCREARADGFDPREKRNAERVEAKVAIAKATTFDDAAARYIAAHKAGWRNGKHEEQWTNSLARYATPVLGALPVSAIDTELVLKVLEPIWTTKSETARRVRNRVELILDWAKARSMRDGENPARWRGHLDKLLPAIGKVRNVKHHAALDYAELPAFMQKLRAQDNVWARALEFTILTGMRGDEVRDAPVAEIDIASKSWAVPGPRMKGGLDHRVPLCARAGDRHRTDGGGSECDARRHQRGLPVSRHAPAQAGNRRGDDGRNPAHGAQRHDPRIPQHV
jgi:hypothetical protein